MMTKEVQDSYALWRARAVEDPDLVRELGARAVKPDSERLPNITNAIANTAIKVRLTVFIILFLYLSYFD